MHVARSLFLLALFAQAGCYNWQHMTSLEPSALSRETRIRVTTTTGITRREIPNPRLDGDSLRGGSGGPLLAADVVSADAYRHDAAATIMLGAGAVLAIIGVGYALMESSWSRSWDKWGCETFGGSNCHQR